MPTVTLPPDLPARMKRLPRDEVGRPVPFFVATINGKPDFRVMDPDHLVRAVKEQLCFICGERLLRVHGSNAPSGTFVAGPMCVINRTSAEPPNHADCAEWSAKACPFLTKPLRNRREANMPDLVAAAGIAIMRNPGVTALIESPRWRVFRAGEGVLFGFTRVTNVRWMAEGKGATTEQVLESIETGLPDLVEVAETEPGALPALARATRDALSWVPGVNVEDYPTIAATLAATP